MTPKELAKSEQEYARYEGYSREDHRDKDRFMFECIRSNWEEIVKLCSEECTPCCDYCKYVVHEVIEFENNKVVGGPIFCKLHLDEEHRQLARRCSYCEDFWCMNADKDIVAVELNKED